MPSQFEKYQEWNGGLDNEIAKQQSDKVEMPFQDIPKYKLDTLAFPDFKKFSLYPEYVPSYIDDHTPIIGTI